MGYRCPVCDVVEADAVHLANHLAVTASLGRADHEVWLDDCAPDWGEHGPDELAAVVADHATEVETPEFDEGDHDRGRPAGLEDGIARQSRQPGRGAMTAETERVLREARELTRQMGPANDDEADAGADGGENENA